MAGFKRRDSVDNQLQKKDNKSRFNKSSGKHGGRDGKRKKNTGPRLPSAFRKQLNDFKTPNLHNSDDDEIFESDEDEININNDFYEYEEEVAEEESMKNKRFDHVDNYEYELPQDFKDEDISSDDDDEDVLFHGDDDEGSDDGVNDDRRHARMLKDITGIPTEAFEGKKRKRNVVSEAYPESEFNPSRDVLSGNSQISIQDLLGPLRGTSGYNKLRKRIEIVDKKGATVQTPLPKPQRERVEREVAYDDTKKHITKWEGLVKRNREAPTLYFESTGDMGLSTVGAMASEFKPRSDFEKAIASIFENKEVAEAYKTDGAKLLELNKISAEEVKERHNSLAKMRSLLFRHEMKAKHIKKIKSKTYHRLKKKDRLKGALLDMEADPEAAREQAEKQERRRAEERMTLKHKNQGKWAKRVLERGLSIQDEGTRAAVAEQLHQHNLLKRKMNSVKDSSSSDDSSDEDDEDYSSDENAEAKLLAKAKEKTIKLMEQEEELPNSGVFSLPFMVRGLEKRKQVANEEAKSALEEYESSLKKGAVDSIKNGTPSGRRVFGATQNKVKEANIKHRPDVDNFGSDSEDIIEEKDDIHVEPVNGNDKDKDVDIDLDVLREGLDTDNDSAFKCVIDVVEDPKPKTSHGLSIFTSGSWKKIKSGDKGDSSADANIKSMPEGAITSRSCDSREEAEDSDTDSGEHMIDGMLSSGTKQTYELPSNEELIKRAFAGDDVEVEFEKAKDDILNEENPEPEKPVLLPGWGEWTDVQKKKGVPSWMKEEHANAKRKREEALAKRKDARLKHVIISEKIDKKAEKLHAKTLPYPFTSKDVFEQSIRMPIGPEFNPASTVRDLIKPEVVKKSGMIIKPIKYEEIDPHERITEQKQQGKQDGQRQRTKSKSSGKKTKHSNKK
ncbi:unnamed protein product [Amaranthus hypochondriacus]